MGLQGKGTIEMIRIAFADDESMIAVEYRKSRRGSRRLRSIKRALKRTTARGEQNSGPNVSPSELVALLADSMSEFRPPAWRNAR